MSAPIPFLLVGLKAILSDPSFAEGGKGYRKIAVTEIYPQTEREADQPVWNPPDEQGKFPVLVNPDWEMSVFTQACRQDRHYHLQGTEMYIVAEGRMEIEVDGGVQTINRGEIMIINPPTVHEVLRESHFLAVMININCGGKSDKYLA